MRQRGPAHVANVALHRGCGGFNHTLGVRRQVALVKDAVHIAVPTDGIVQRCPHLLHSLLGQSGLELRNVLGGDPRARLLDRGNPGAEVVELGLLQLQCRLQHQPVVLEPQAVLLEHVLGLVCHLLGANRVRLKAVRHRVDREALGKAALEAAELVVPALGLLGGDVRRPSPSGVAVSHGSAYQCLLGRQEKHVVVKGSRLVMHLQLLHEQRKGRVQVLLGNGLLRCVVKGVIHAVPSVEADEHRRVGHSIGHLLEKSSLRSVEGRLRVHQQNQDVGVLAVLVDPAVILLRQVEAGCVHNLHVVLKQRALLPRPVDGGRSALILIIREQGMGQLQHVVHRHLRPRAVGRHNRGRLLVHPHHLTKTIGGMPHS
mmetsp:Transcript_33367/g.87522  ORF Transcript_33367/g.87522 Transcript_33367/m.87522 type:complete len:372 (+) Transcript_33367:842-1957(+)